MSKSLEYKTQEAVQKELESLPPQYADSTFNSTHEGLAVIEEEFEELKQEVFFGQKTAINELIKHYPTHMVIRQAHQIHKNRMRKECIQIMAMCARFIQELTPFPL